MDSFNFTKKLFFHAINVNRPFGGFLFSIAWEIFHKDIFNINKRIIVIRL